MITFGLLFVLMRVVKLYNTDESIINGIRESDDKALEYLYKEHYYMIRQLVVMNSGSQPDAEDILQDGIIVLYEKIKEGDFKLTCSIKTYLYAVCKNLWLKCLEKKKNFIPFKDYHNETISIEEDLFEEEIQTDNQNILAELLNKISEACKEIIVSFYYEKLSMSDIARKLGFANADYAKTQKYRCLQKLKEMINKKYNKEDILKNL